MAVSDRARRYVRDHAGELSLEDLACGARLKVAEVRGVLREEGLSPTLASTLPEIPLLDPQAPRPPSRPASQGQVAIALAVGAGSFLVYLFTLARDITGEDCGELVAAAKLLGVAHPPGYPLWCLLGKVFSWIPIGSAVFRVGLLSAAGAAVTAGLVSFLVSRLTNSLAAAVSGGLLLAFSRDLWSQAVIPEVYTLNTAFLAATLVLAWRWYETRRPRAFFLLALTLGFSLTNHSTMGPLVVLFAVFVFLVNWNLWREPGTLPLGVLIGLAPLLLYAYLPIRAEAKTLMNWGDPRTPDAFLDHVLRRQYAFEYTAATRTPARTWQQILSVARDAGAQFTPWLSWLAIPGAILLLRRSWRFGGLLLATFAATTVGFVVLLNFPLEREKLTAYRLFYLPAWVIAAIWIGVALAEAGALARRLSPGTPKQLAWVGCALALLPLLTFWRVNDKSGYRVVRQYVEAILATLPPNAMIVPSGDHSSFPLVYVQAVEQRRLDVTIVDKYGYTDPVLLDAMPGSLRIGVPRIPPVDADLRFQDWLFTNTRRPVFFTSRRSLAGIPGHKLVPHGILFRLVRPGESVTPKDPWEEYDFSSLDDRPRDYSADVIASEVYTARGVAKAARRDLTGAKTDFALAAEATAGIKEGLNNLGSACAEAGMNEDARGYLERALAIDPDYRMALRNLVTVLSALKKWTEAKGVIARLVALDPHDLGARLLLVQLYRGQGNLGLAVFELEILARDNPRNSELLVAAGDMSLQDGDSLSALTYYQRALEIEPRRSDLRKKVQDLLMNESIGAPPDPFRMPGSRGPGRHPGIPQDPLEGLHPPISTPDPMDPFRRR